MARVQAPLMSEAASGNVGGLLSAEGRAGRAYIYRTKIRRGLQKGQQAGYGRNRNGRTVFGYRGLLSATTFSAVQGARRQVFAEGRRQYSVLDALTKKKLASEAEPMFLTGALLWQRRFMAAAAIF